MPPPRVRRPQRKKRTIQEIRDSKHTGEKMVYMSVPDYTAARWAEMAGVDVAVVGDSLAMIAHGHPNTIPATMDMMVMHAQAIRRGAPNTFVLGCMPYQSYNTVDRALTNATRFMQEAGVRRGEAAGRQVAGAHPEGAGRRRHPDRLAHRPDAAHGGDVRRLQDPGQDGRRGDEDPRGRARDPGRRLLHARVRGGAGEDRRGDLEAARDPHHRHRRRRRHRRPDPALPRPARRLHRLQAQVHQALLQPDRGRGEGHHAVHRRGEGRHLPRRRPQLRRRREGVREVRRRWSRSASTTDEPARRACRSRRRRASPTSPTPTWRR